MYLSEGRGMAAILEPKMPVEEGEANPWGELHPAQHGTRVLSARTRFPSLTLLHSLYVIAASTLSEVPKHALLSLASVPLPFSLPTMPFLLSLSNSSVAFKTPARPAWNP